MTYNQCVIVSCTRPAQGGGYCGPCAWYYRVFLANPWWRDHEPPAMTPDGSVQLALRVGP